MKPITQKFWILLSSLCTAFAVSAYDFEVDGIYYNVVSLTNLTCSVTKGDSKYQGDITIPAEVTYNSRKFSVRGIGSSAFYYCSSLTSVTIPNSVTSIGSDAFFRCTSLTSITIPNSVTSIGSQTFYNCASLASITIPNAVTSIGSYTFYDCTALASITIPNSVTEIGDFAFYSCSSLTSITIPNSVTSIGANAFSGCSALKSIVLSDNLESIQYGLFENCSNLESLGIPGSVSYISQYFSQYYDNRNYSTFYKCNNLKKLRILNSPSELQVGYYDTYWDMFKKSDWNYKYNWTNTITDLYIDRNLAERIPVPNLKNLEIGESLSYIPVDYLSGLQYLQSIKSYAAVPPELPTMSNKQYMNLNVYVPKEHLAAYQQADGWKDFWNLQGVDFGSIDDCVANSSEVITIATGNGTICIDNKPADAIARVYTLQGRLVAETADSIVGNLAPGLYIITIGSKTFKILL